MQQSASGEASNSSVRQDKPGIFLNWGSLTNSQMPAIFSQSISCLLKLFNINLQSTPMSSRWPFPLRCPHQKPAWTPAILTCYMLSLTNYFWFAHPINISWRIYPYLSTVVPYLQMHSVMLHSVTTVHQMAILNSRTLLVLCTSKVIQQNWANTKTNYFITEDYEAEDLCLFVCLGLLHCSRWYNWYCYITTTTATTNNNNNNNNKTIATKTTTIRTKTTT